MYNFSLPVFMRLSGALISTWAAEWDPLPPWWRWRWPAVWSAAAGRSVWSDLVRLPPIQRKHHPAAPSGGPPAMSTATERHLFVRYIYMCIFTPQCSYIVVHNIEVDLCEMSLHKNISHKHCLMDLHRCSHWTLENSLSGHAHTLWSHPNMWTMRYQKVAIDFAIMKAA